MKKVLLGIIILVIILLVVLIIKTFTYPFASTKNLAKDPAEFPINEKAVKRLSEAIQIPTVSTVEYGETNFEPFEQFHTFLQQSYPLIFEKLDTATVNKYGLVFHWKGKNSSKKPLLFLSHYDVVPINNYDFANPPAYTPVFNISEKATPLTEYQDAWTYPPFSGAVDHGRIYGRGTLDMKGMLISILEGADQLLEEGYQPEQDIYFAFGHDEEVSGRQGALKIAEYFKNKNIEFDAVYDEGGYVVSPGSVIKSIDKAIALVGVAEKGFLTLQITVKGTGGHSSMPPKKGSLVLASEIVERLNTDQMPAMITDPIEYFLKNVGGSMDFKSQLAISNQWLLKGLLIKSLENDAASNALIRTTTALTMAHSSDAPNVLSATTEITVNFRILQGNTVEDVMNHVKQVCEGYDVDYKVISSREPSKISDINGEPFQKVQKTIAEVYPNAIISSYLTIGGTDAYKYEIVSDNVFRFMPIEINQYDQRLIHNDNESITIDNYMRMIHYFKLLMK
ncbi:M20/M25/M40 family metallo-hydrolase [Sphingobacterium rhinopitheci]|uniref:M20/M25/M40 family metallo-hydrolase n=1 Tax=Sphingobacterium rhinopitheci TaxID=2781960 RepID=UPI001F516A64|nr:M20/M25/M40 family metallo-hydrolase [Sphingobacterium rhinopitheci]MCI0922188.1 M20/M25/M40 family metallo-hydrolase [Sphingobacterium rhinopitheci]